MRHKFLVLICAFWISDLTYAADAYRYTAHSAEGASTISIDPKAHGYSSGNEIFTLSTCNTSDKFECYFTEVHTFAVPRNREVEIGKRWKFKGYEFLVESKLILRTLGSSVEVFRIEARKKNKLISIFLYSPTKGLSGIIETVNVGEWSYSEVFIGEQSVGFGTTEKPQKQNSKRR